MSHLQSLCHEDWNSDNEDEVDLPVVETRRLKRRKVSESDPQASEKRPPLLRVGDHLILVRFGCNNIIGVYVSRFWLDRIEDEHNFFYLFVSTMTSQYQHLLSLLSQYPFLSTMSMSIMKRI